MTTTTTSAPGADQLSSRIDVSTSPATASQTAVKKTEPDRVPATCKAQAGGHRVTRRNLMNIAINAGALVAAPPIAVAASVVSQEPSSAFAMLRRAEHCVECLRTRYVCDGWKMDEEAAERMLQYFRSQAEGQPENDEEWQAAVAFIGSHGQSLDWILRGEPEVMICGVASRSDRASGIADAALDEVVIEYGRRFQEQFERFMPAWFEWAKRMRAARNETEEKFGKDRKGPAWKRKWEEGYVKDGSAWEFLHEATLRHGAREADKALNPIREEIDRLADLIQNFEIKTLPGLRAKALVAIWGMRPMRASHDGFLYCGNDDDDLVSLIQGAIAVTGLSDYYEAFAYRVWEDGPKVDQEDTEAA
jgi:hypothetical protein